MEWVYVLDHETGLSHCPLGSPPAGSGTVGTGHTSPQRRRRSPACLVYPSTRRLGAIRRGSERISGASNRMRAKATAQKGEAPTCMRCRGLARTGRATSRLLSRLAPPDRHRPPDARPKRRFPGPPAVPGSPRVSLRRAAVMKFYSLCLTRHKGFPEAVSRFFSRPQDICHYPPRLAVFPPTHPQDYPQLGTASVFAPPTAAVVAVAVAPAEVAEQALPSPDRALSDPADRPDQRVG